MALIILGLSHKTASIEMREKVAFDSGQLPHALDQLNAASGVREALILSTCNRTELYCDIEPHGERQALDWLASHRELSLEEIEPHLYCLSDEYAVRHALRVASGLDSLVLGEPQILGQLKEAYRSAVTAGTVGKFINRLMQFSFATAKQIRSQTEIGNSPVSVAYAAVKLAQRIHGQLSERSALLIGAGDTISLVATHLAAAGLQRLVIANRSYANAELLATRFSGEAIELSRLPQHIHEVDIIVTSTASRLPIVTRGLVELALKARNHEPMFIVDLAVPRDVEPSVGELDDVYLYSVDDLEKVIASNVRVREEAAAQAEEMVHLQVRDYMQWLQLQSSADVIAGYRARGESLREDAVKVALARLKKGDDPQRIIEHLARGLTNKLMHQPTTSLRAASGREDYLRIARDLLGFESDRFDS